MIFRRLGAAIARQDWFVVIIELTVLILGIFIGLEQTRQALATMITAHSASGSFTYMPAKFPELIKAVSYFDTELGEVRAAMECDLEAMRASREFLNHWSANADGYDGYVRDGLKPWSDQLDRVHAMVDGALAVKH